MGRESALTLSKVVAEARYDLTWFSIRKHRGRGGDTLIHHVTNLELRHVSRWQIFKG